METMREMALELLKEAYEGVMASNENAQVVLRDTSDRLTASFTIRAPSPTKKGYHVEVQITKSG